MSTQKRKLAKKDLEEESANGSMTGSSESEELRVVPKKNSKRSKVKDTETSASSSGEKKVNEEGEVYFKLSDNRRITIREFRGKPLIDIREFFSKDGKELPGKKGISLSPEQLEKFKELLPEIDTALKAL